MRRGAEGHTGHTARILYDKRTQVHTFELFNSDEQCRDRRCTHDRGTAYTFTKSHCGEFILCRQRHDHYTTGRFPVKTLQRVVQANTQTPSTSRQISLQPGRKKYQASHSKERVLITAESVRTARSSLARHRRLHARNTKTSHLGKDCVPHFAYVRHVLDSVARHLAAVHQPVLPVPIQLNERAEGFRLGNIFRDVDTMRADSG